MSKEKKLIPILRFPEFVNEGEWEEMKFEKLCKFIRGPFGGALKKEIFVKDGYAVYEQSHAIYNDFSSFRYFISEEKFNELKRFSVLHFDIIMSCSGTMGKFAIVPKEAKKGIINQALLKLTVREAFNVNFVKEILELPVNQDKLLSQSAGGAIKNVVEVAQIKEIKLIIPQLNEQQKIASCLSSLDEVIAAHNQKLELLKEHKKSLMQNLFPQEGETAPKYRFPEFVKDGEWVEKKLGELGDFLGGGTPSRTNSEYWTGNIPWISSSDIKEDDIHNIAISQFINENAIIESATKIIPKGSILFVSRVGVGKLAINNEELCTSQDFTSFIPTEVLNLFVAYYYSANKNALQSLSQGTSIKGFSKSDLEDSKIVYPRYSKEQQKIASCLSSLDAIIAAQTDRIEQLNLHKKGLMQGLFPKVNK